MRTPDFEKSSETLPTQNRISVVCGRHVIGDSRPWGPSVWSPETLQVVANLSPSPTIFAIDSLVPGWFVNAALDYAPFNESNHVARQGNVHLLAGDIPDQDHPSFMIGDRGVPHETWVHIFDSLASVNPAFRPPKELNAFIGEQMGWAYGADAIGIAAMIFAGKTYLHMVEDLRKNKHVGKDPYDVPPDPGRRKFIMTSISAVVGGGLSLLRWPIFDQALLHPNVMKGWESLPSTVVNLTKPILYNYSYLRMRNTKIGLTTLDYLIHVAPFGTTAAEVLGTVHEATLYPGQQAGESLEAARLRLFRSYKDDVSYVLRDVMRRYPTVAPRVLAGLGKTIFADYDDFLLPQRKKSRDISDGIGMKIDKNSFRTIPEVAQLIDDVVGVTNTSE